MKSEENVELKSFSQWLGGNKKYFLFLLSILPIVINIFLNIPKGNGSRAIIGKPDIMLIPITTVIQCIFILFVIFLPVKEKLFLVTNNKDKDSKIYANEAVMQFKNAWTFVWASWLFLYSTLFIKYLIPRSVSIPPLSWLNFSPIGLHLSPNAPHFSPPVLHLSPPGFHFCPPSLHLILPCIHFSPAGRHLSSPCVRIFTYGLQTFPQIR